MKSTRSINQKLKEVEVLPAGESREILSEITLKEVIDEEEENH